MNVHEVPDALADQARAIGDVVLVLQISAVVVRRDEAPPLRVRLPSVVDVKDVMGSESNCEHDSRKM